MALHIHIHSRTRDASGLTFEEWKQAQEYEGRLFGGAYNWTRVEGLRGGSSHKTSPMRAAILLARTRYDALRVKAGLSPIANWRERPGRAELVQYLPAPEMTPQERKARGV